MVKTRSIPLSRSAAVLLAFLIVLPFTAPFSSCPLSLFQRDGQASAAVPGVTASAHEALSQDSQSVLTEEQLKDEAAVPGVQAVYAERARFQYRTLILKGAVSPSVSPLVLRL